MPTIAELIGPSLAANLLPSATVFRGTITLYREGVSQGARLVAVYPNSGSRLQQTATADSIYAADFLVGGNAALAGTIYDGDVLVGEDVMTGVTRAFALIGEPVYHNGLLEAPAKPCPLPNGVS